MSKTFRNFLGVMMIAPLVALTPIAQAAQATTQTVKIALLDMSSIAGPGMGPGNRQGMGPGNQQGMGPGSRQGMSPGGGQGMVPGMGPGSRQGMGAGTGPGRGTGMGPGWGWGGGQGAGWMAQSMMGPGMMGMGMMSIRASTGTVKAGKIRFEVVNYSASIEHEMEVIAVDDLNAPLPYNYKTAKVTVDKAKELGETEHMKSGDAKTLELTLPAGNYLLVCNIPGHYAAGMVTPFTVTP